LTTYPKLTLGSWDGETVVMSDGEAWVLRDGAWVAINSVEAGMNARVRSESDEEQMEERKQIIPVRLGTPTRNGGSEFTFCPPLVAINIASDQEWTKESGQWPRDINPHKRYALIDTGADHSAIDRAVAAEIGAVPIGSGYTNTWIGTDENVPFVKLQIVIPPRVLYGGEAAIKDSRWRGQQWDVVLGRDFLQFCCLWVDGRSCRYHLEYFGDETSPPT
jgi:hypothetical protein